MVARLLAAEKPAGHAVLLNVNMPKNEPRGVKVTRVGRHVYEERVLARLDPGGREYFWIGGKVIDYGDVRGSDKKAVDEGFVSVTALALEASSSEHVGMADLVAGPSAERAF
jgi:5'-nucleotidase